MSKLKLIAVGGVLLASFPALAKDDLRNHMSFAGYTGIFHTPTAEVLEKGYFSFHYNNQLDYRGINYLDGHNFVFTAGLFEGFEISGAIASVTMHRQPLSWRRDLDPTLPSEPGKRDLSFNVKYQLPVIPKDWFTVAVGVKDFGGAANQYETYYIAASKEWRNFRLSTGVGSNSRAHGQMNGAFAGLEWQPWDWLALQVEHDAEAVNAGARLIIPERWLFDVGSITLTSRFYSSTDIAENETFWGINFTMPISRQARRLDSISAPQSLGPYSSTAERRADSPVEDSLSMSATESRSEAAAGSIERPSVERASAERTASWSQRQRAIATESPRAETSNVEYRNGLALQAQNLRAAILRDGFEGVSVGFNQSAHFVVQFENYVFNRNDLDALGLVMGRISEHVYAVGAEFTVQLVNRGLPMMAISGKVDNYRAFIFSETAPELDIRRGRMQAVTGVAWVGLPGANSPYFKPRVTLSPELSTRIATELGVYDYALALNASVDVPMWRGGGLSVSAQTSAVRTDDYEPGQVFHRFNPDRGLTQAALYHTMALPFGIYYQAHVGFFQEFHDFTGIKNELMWMSKSGRHQIGSEFAYLEYNDFNATTDYQIATYRYNWVEQDISFHVSAGRFFYGDEGAKLEARFWFGDSYIALYAQSTDVNVAGVGFSIPLTPRKELAATRTRYGQVSGNPAWRHSVGSRIGESTNALAIGRAHQLATPVGLERTFFNQGRLTPLYIENNTARLREVFLTYR